MGTNTKNTIDINGKRYDALTGEFLGNSSSSPTLSQDPRPQRQVIDGFVRVSRGVQHHKTVKQAAKPKTFSLSRQRKAHMPGQHAKPHLPQKSNTLMRSAVKKPVIKSPKQIKAQARTDILAKVPMQTVVPKISYNSINKVRVNRAERMIKSSSVSRYGAVTHIAPPPRPQHVRPSSYVQPGQAAVARPEKPSVSPDKRELDIFEKAIAHATSHEQTYRAPKSPKKRSRFAGYAAASLAVLTLIGFIAYQNIPGLSVRLASTRAGFEAKLPAYQPAGYAFGDLSYSPGNVKVSYASKETESLKYDITQRSSDWDSQTLLNNFVMSASEAYKTYERAGRTIYLYGNNTATWVDSGVWFIISGGGSLSNSQLLDLAISL